MGTKVELKCTCERFGKCQSCITLEEYEESKFVFEYQDIYNQSIRRRIYISKNQLIELKKGIDEMLKPVKKEEI